MAVWCGVGAGAAHFMWQRMRLTEAWRRTLVRMQLLDDAGALFLFCKGTPDSYWAAWDILLQWAMKRGSQRTCARTALGRTLTLSNFAQRPGRWGMHQQLSLDVERLYVLSDPAAIQAQLEAPPTEFEPRPEAELGWRRYLPVRKMTAEEWARYRARKDLSFDDRCAALR